MNVVSDVNTRNFDSSSGIVLKYIVELLGVVGGGICCQISRKCNMMAHTIVVVGLRSLGCLVGDKNLFSCELV